MDAALIARLEAFVSAPRLQRYRDAGRNDREAIVLYYWNIRLAEALLPALASFEVTLRNSVHDCLTTYAGTEWWFKQVLHTEMYRNILDVIATITKKQGQPPTIGKVISEIMFGFWPKVFSRGYNDLWWNHSAPMLPTILPHYPRIGRHTRGEFEARLEYFVALRNRVAHHEAVFEGIAAINRPMLSIDVLHDQLIETIGWLNPDAQRFVRRIDRFSDVFSAIGQAALEREIKAEFKMP